MGLVNDDQTERVLAVLFEPLVAVHRKQCRAHRLGKRDEQRSEDEDQAPASDGHASPLRTARAVQARQRDR